MKLDKVLLMLLFLLVSLSFSACGGGGDSEDGDIDTDTEIDTTDGDDDPEMEAVEDTETEPDSENDADGDDEMEDELEAEVDGDDEDNELEPEIELEPEEELEPEIELEPELEEVEPEEELEAEDELEVAPEEEIEPEIELEPELEEAEFEEEEIVCSVDYTFSNVADLNNLTNQTTIGQDNSIASDCFLWDMNGKDVVYEVELYVSEIYQITVTPSSNVDIAIYVADACDIDASCIHAEDSNDEGVAETIEIMPSTSQVYYLVVDSSDPSAETDFTISVSISYPGVIEPTYACEEDSDCDPNAGAGLCVGNNDIKACTVSCATNTDCTNAGYNSGCCLELNAEESYCYLSLDCGTAGQTAGIGEECATGINPNLPMCDTSASATDCISNTVYTSSYCTSNCNNDGECSTYFTNGSCVTLSSGNFCVREEDAPQTCQGSSGITLIQSSQLPIQLSGMLRPQKNKVNAFSCAEVGSPGRDYIYQIYLTAGQSIYATLSSVVNFDAILQVVEQCGWTTDEANCLAYANNNGFQAGEELLFTAPENGYYNIVVDATAYDIESTYLLDLEMVEIEQEADGDDEAEMEEEEQFICIADLHVNRDSLPYSRQDSNYGVDNTLSINTGCGAVATPANDLIYSVELLANDNLIIDLTATTNWDPTIMVYSACQNDACLVMEDSAGSGQSESISFTADSDGTYFIVVDAKTEAIGNFTINLSLNNADGDEVEMEAEISQCEVNFTIGNSSNLPYTNNTETTFSVNQVTASATSQSCLGFATEAADHIYLISLNQNDTLDVYLSNVGTISQGGEFDPVLYISSECSGELDCLAASDYNGNAGDEFIQNFTAPYTGMYYIIVDSPFPAQTGYYDITVTTGGSIDGDVELSE